MSILSGVFGASPSFASAVDATAYTYDAANRLTTRGYGDGLNDSFAYDPASRLTGATSGRYADSVARTYDAAGRLTAESLTLPDGSLSGTTVAPATYSVGYAYDAANRLTSLAYPTGTAVARTYSDRNELTGVTLAGNPVATRTYDVGGRLVTTAYGNGLSEARTYVPGDVLVAGLSTAPASGPAVVGFAYTYDADKRKLSENDTVATQGQSFAYDDASRLTTWNRSGGGPAPSAQTWNLSLVGDWLSTSRDGVAEPRTNTAVHEAVQVGANALAYDMKGNLATDEHGNALAWDPENRLTRALVTPDASTTGVGAVATYRYDALGRRIAKTVQNRTTLYLDAGAQTVVEIDRAAIPAQADLNGATADGTLANAAQTPASGGILSGSGVTRINFQPSTTAIPAGFLADKGKISDVRTNGLTYGWSSDVTAQAVERDAASLVEYDTCIQAQTDTTSATWSIALPNGSYPVVVVAGDAASTNQTDNLVIGGVAVTDTTPATTSPGYDQGNFDGYAVQATVTNGVLSIAPGSGAFHAKLCFVEIGAADTPANVAATIAAVQPKLAAMIQKMNDQTGATPDPVNKVREYAYGSYVDEVLGYRQAVGGVVGQYFVHSNHLYSPAALTDLTGGVVERYTYDAYGRQTITSGAGAGRSRSAVGFDRGFTGYVADQETGLLYARARMYSPGLGRFVGRDPDGFVDGYSMYRAYFCPGFVDPSGMGYKVLYNQPEEYGENDGNAVAPICKCLVLPKGTFTGGDILVVHGNLYVLQKDDGTKVCRYCKRTPESENYTKTHEEKHIANVKAKIDELNGKYSKTYSSPAECDKASVAWMKEYEDWFAKEQKHANPESPKPSDPQHVFDDSLAHGLCAPEIPYPPPHDDGK